MFVEIEDEVLAPYTIEIDDHNYTVYKHGKVMDRESKNFGEPTKLLVSYCNNFPAALQKILNNKVNTKARTTDLEGYMRDIKKQYDKLFAFFEKFDLETVLTKARGTKEEEPEEEEVEITPTPAKLKKLLDKEGVKAPVEKKTARKKK